jgi:hypothetical protein
MLHTFFSLYSHIFFFPFLYDWSEIPTSFLSSYQPTQPPMPNPFARSAVPFSQHELSIH